MTTTTPFPVPSLNRSAGVGQVGTGVQVDEIRRLRDGFLDLQLRKESTKLGYWNARQDALQKIEGIFNEPSDSGLCAVFEQFWQSLESLSTTPASLASRSLVVQRGLALAETFNHFDASLEELQQDLNASIEIRVNEINSIGRQISELNLQILKVEVSGSRANDLRDRRDLLIDQLAKIVNTEVIEDEKGVVQVNIGAQSLVQGGQVNLIQATPNKSNPDVIWAADGEPVEITSGAMRGLIEMRGYGEGSEQVSIQDLREKLDTLAGQFAEEFNEIHKSGYGLDGAHELNFFVNKEGNSGGKITAGNITVNSDIVQNPKKIAAAIEDPEDPAAGAAIEAENGGSGKGDGGNALELIGLKQKAIVDGFTPEDYYRAVIGELGVAGQEAYRMVENQELLVSQVENDRQSVSGVYLDEELINMIRFQHAYGAASRLITTIDEMLELIISRMGLVGR